MLFVACTGFPVPVSRYFQEFNAVEVSDTELGIPGDGTRRRWLREAPRGSAFSVLAPKRIPDSHFALEEENTAALVEVGRFAKALNAIAVVFASRPEFGPTRPNKTKLRRFFQSLPDGLPQPVVDLEGWSVEQTQAALRNPRVLVARNPLEEKAGGHREPERLEYLRLPGPSGYRSRYTDETVDRVVEYCRTSAAETTFCVFCNIDRYVHAARALAALHRS